MCGGTADSDAHGGDPACWLHELCPACGAVPSPDPPGRCWRCGAVDAPTDERPGGGDDATGDGRAGACPDR